MRTLDGAPGRSRRLPHEPLEIAVPADVARARIHPAWLTPVPSRPRLELAGPPERVTYHVTYIHDPEHPSGSGWFVVGSSGAHHGPLAGEAAADQYRDYLENFPRMDPRD